MFKPGANVIKPYFIERRYKDPFSVVRKYGENVRNTEMQSFITLTPGRFRIVTL